MKFEKYQLKKGEKPLSFEFVSEGLKGPIYKVIQFTIVNEHDVYNLALGDKDLKTGEVDFSTISNNGDIQQLLATVVEAVYIFFDRYPDAWIHAYGDTSTRRRLYNIAINKYFDGLKGDFHIYGKFDNIWERYKKRREYTAFLVQRKNPPGA